MITLIEQYRLVAAGAGWIDCTRRGYLRVDGTDARTFLHALLTNDIETLVPGRGVYAAWLTPQGRMITDVEVWHRADFLMVSVPRGAAASLAARLDALVFAEDVRITDTSAAWAEFAVVGPAAAPIVATLMHIDETSLAALEESSHVPCEDGIVVRGGDALLPFFRVIVPAHFGAPSRVRLGQTRAIEISEALAETLRIDAGRPVFGVDMDETTIPLEAGLLERAISTTKGCYVGQEVIIRVLHRGGGRVAKRLVTLEVRARAVPDLGAALVQADHPVGRVTSVGAAPDCESVVALGYLTREVAEVGTIVAVGHAGGPTAVVTGFAR